MEFPDIDYSKDDFVDALSSEEDFVLDSDSPYQQNCRCGYDGLCESDNYCRKCGIKINWYSSRASQLNFAE